jgi:hypothetical protein
MQRNSLNDKSPWRRGIAGRPVVLLLLVALSAALGVCPSMCLSAETLPLRLIIETDAGGDPDDEQSLVRFLLCANEWDVVGIIANRPTARDGENENPERTGLGIVRRQLTAYGQCWPNLVKHDPRYPPLDLLWQRTVAGYEENTEAVQLIIAAVDDPDPRPVWYSDWGTDVGGATNNLRRALDKVLKERGPEGYAKFKSRLRLASANAFAEHTDKIEPPFLLWVDTFRPELDRRRWYHRFSAITATAGGFDIERDLRRDHGPLGAMYPLNTTHPQKEGDSMTFLYLLPGGLSDPHEPTWGGRAGRHGLNPTFPGRPYYWANQVDTWHGTTNRDNTLARWAAAIQHDFAARADWCVADEYSKANHHPRAVLEGDSSRAILRQTAKSGEKVELSSATSSDPDGDRFTATWFAYPEAGTCREAVTLSSMDGEKTSFVAPRVSSPQTVHVILQVEDDGTPTLTSCRRAVIEVRP